MKQEKKQVKKEEIHEFKDGTKYSLFNNSIRLIYSMNSRRLTEYNEDYKEYKIRRTYINDIHKKRKRLVWNSKKQGTYVK